MTKTNTINPVFLQSCDFYGKDKSTVLFNADAVIEAVLSNEPSARLIEAYEDETQRMLGGTSMTEEEAKFAALTVLLANAYGTDTALIEPEPDSRAMAARAWADGFEAGRAAAATG